MHYLPHTQAAWLLPYGEKYGLTSALVPRYDSLGFKSCFFFGKFFKILQILLKEGAGLRGSVHKVGSPQLSPIYC
jgi:hypothetical protein